MKDTLNEALQEILQTLVPLFKKADKEGLWFFHRGLSGLLWFSPNELREEHKKGQFLWGAVNWTLKDPQERLKVILAEIEGLNKKYREFEARIANEIRIGG